MKTLILLSHGLVEAPKSSKNSKKISNQMIGTLFSNMAHYGYVPSKELASAILETTLENVTPWWASLEAELKVVTGANKNMDKYVVYKNFPKEVLDMSQGEYWIKQILMYIGLPNELFTETEVVRDKLFEKQTLKVLHLAKANSLVTIASELALQPSRWTEAQFVEIEFLAKTGEIEIDFAAIPFKENLVKLIASVMQDEKVKVSLKSATDVLRLAIAITGGDITMKTNSKFQKVSRPTRRFLLKMLNKLPMEEDFARRPEQWKRLLKALRPNDYGKKYGKVCAAYDKLYNNQVESFNSKVETLLENEDKAVLNLLSTRPGEFVRRLHKVSSVFGKTAGTAFSKVLPSLKTIQLLKMSKYLETINDRTFRVFPPKGNWSLAKVFPNTVKIDPALRMSLLNRINKEIGSRTTAAVGAVNLDEATRNVKIQTSDNELASYGRGTVFAIPDNITFLRTASFWKAKRGHSVWFDNGWNFFDNNWQPLGACCWLETKFGGVVSSSSRRGWGLATEVKNPSAVFSGDPTNVKDLEGKACQMIDLYLDRLEEQGVAYAVWNILCFSRIPFCDAEEVHAALQWGEKPQEGKTFEPSRVQLSLPVGGKTFTKYVAYLDVKRRNIVYMDANFAASVSSATSNGKKLSAIMPAYVEYLNSLPSIHDLFKGAKKSKKGVPVVYDDAEMKIEGGKAFVFKPTNEANKFEQLEVSRLL